MHHRRASNFQTNPKNTAGKLVTSSKEIYLQVEDTETVCQGLFSREEY